ncbi:MAG: hypothetical protein FJY11_05185 [Bacteroidetes bacterium]|nr:hypothetical protein [Bacteroidota bacterium]
MAGAGRGDGYWLLVTGFWFTFGCASGELAFGSVLVAGYGLRVNGFALPTFGAGLRFAPPALPTFGAGLRFAPPERRRSRPFPCVLPRMPDAGSRTPDIRHDFCGKYLALNLFKP